MGRLIDLTSQRFGRLVVLERSTDAKKQPQWLCVCDCGTQCVVMGAHLRWGHTLSCGCLQIERAGDAGRTHGEAGSKRTAEYRAWALMLRRCNNPNSHEFKYYGGRGITVCAEWLNSYEAFLAHLGRRPSPQHSVDRFPDNNGNYEPGNVRWATRHQQSLNQRRNAHSDAGVCYRPDCTQNPWLVMLGGQYLGCFPTKDAAIAVRQTAREKALA